MKPNTPAKACPAEPKIDFSIEAAAIVEPAAEAAAPEAVRAASPAVEAVVLASSPAIHLTTIFSTMSTNLLARLSSAFVIACRNVSWPEIMPLKALVTSVIKSVVIF